MLIGLTLAKNTTKYKYPLEMCIRQHIGLFDKHIFVTPLDEQDYDDDIGEITRLCKKYGQSFDIIKLDWPTVLGFNEQSIDKKLLTKAVLHLKDQARTLFGVEDVWICKHDIDEFFHEKDFNSILDLIELDNSGDAPYSSISTNYKQLCGSFMYSVFDPTIETTHIFKLSSFVNFPGNDAMNIKTEGYNIYLSDIYLHHIGYVKDEELLTIKVKEHLILNENIYGTDRVKLMAENFTFEFPKHGEGHKLWPLGIGVINGRENITEYTKVEIHDLPLELRLNINNNIFFVPNID